ncbi:Cytochrome P450 monooxygenase AtmP [Madurella fahalii]|uniref:Cytochrome P450 monooxygenase AtmP n=1 Tax=Madurella fahalii TaxID=1157608 RepID=A0ABQ0GL52_9PEZI
MFFSLAVISVLLLCSVSVSPKKHPWPVPSHIWSILRSPVSVVKRRAKAWAFLFRGPSIIQDAYNEAQRTPFFIDVPENRYLVVSSWNHIKEIDAAPDSVLSLQAAAKEVLQPKYTMTNFNWLDKRGVEGTPLIRTLRTLLTNHLPEILPEIRRSMSGLMDTLYDAHPVVNGTKSSPLYSMVVKGIAHSNALAFFGTDLARNETFMKAGIDFIEQTVLIAEILRVLPSVISDPIGKLLSKTLNSGQIMFGHLLPVAAERLEERARQRLGHKVPEHKDCIQWVMETSPKANPWSAERIVHELMALWFGSVHITSTTTCFAIHDLCLRPEYIEPLRKEIESTGWEAFEKSGGKCFPLLDSFMKESARVTPVESVSTRRKALQPFQLSDGSKIDVGQWVCTAPRGMSLDATYYTNPGEFHGFRFVAPELLADLQHTSFQVPQPGKTSTFTEVSDWQLWGTGKCACPGRYYASAAMKTMLGLFITKYDMQLSDPKASRYFAWRTFIYPFPSTTVLLHPRAAV